MSRKKELIPQTQADKQDYTLVLLPTIPVDLFLERNVIYLSIKEGVANISPTVISYVTLGMKNPASFNVSPENFPCLNDLYHLSDPLCAHNAKSVLLPMLAANGDIHQSLHEKFKMSLHTRYRFMQLLMTSYEHFKKHKPKKDVNTYKKKLTALMATLKNDVLMLTFREDNGEPTITHAPLSLDPHMRTQFSVMSLFSPLKILKNEEGVSTLALSIEKTASTEIPIPFKDKLKDQLKSSLTKELYVQKGEFFERKTIEQEMEYTHPAGIKRTAHDVEHIKTEKEKIPSPNRPLSSNVTDTTAITANTKPFSHGIWRGKKLDPNAATRILDLHKRYRT